MPIKLKTRCNHPGCGRTTTGRFCDEHVRGARHLSDDRRGTAPERGYDADWRRIAAERRRLDSFLCQPCLAQGRLTPSKTVDHIIPVHVRPDRRLEVANLQVICPRCHQRKTAADSRVYGSSTQTRRAKPQDENRAGGFQLPPRLPQRPDC